jgi:hypothetical protein
VICQDRRVSAPLSVEPGFVDRVREAFDRADYSASGLQELIGGYALGAIDAEARMAILRRTTGGSPLEALVRLFLAEEPVDEKIARVALAPLTPAQWADGGLVETDGERVRGSVRLRSFERAAGGRAIMASDSWGTKEQAPDHVLGIGSASLGLSHITIRRPVSRTLDLGTGGGVQAMDAALHSESVVATDRNPRAVNFARFNLALNKVPNVEVRQGDLFEPVGGDLFGLIVSNPPFVISPASTLLYRDNPMEGDEFCQLLVRTAAQHLTEGGWCQLLANWAHVKGMDWKQRVGPWFEGTECDAWIIQSQVEEVEQYALNWIRHSAPSAEQASQEFNAWLDYYEGARIEAVGLGMITMRRRSGGAGWVRFDDLKQPLDTRCGEAIATGFELEDWIRAHPDDAGLLASRLAASPDAELQQRSSTGPNGWSVDRQELRLVRGLRFSGTVDWTTANIVAACDGTRTVGELFGDLAAKLGVERSVIATEGCPIVRRLIQQGFLLPAGA